MKGTFIVSHEKPVSSAEKPLTFWKYSETKKRTPARAAYMRQ
jgi:hypothetical protein